MPLIPDFTRYDSVKVPPSNDRTSAGRDAAEGAEPHTPKMKMVTVALDESEGAQSAPAAAEGKEEAKVVEAPKGRAKMKR